MLAEIEREPAGEVDDGALGGVVRGEAAVTAQAGRGCDLHDAAAAAFQVRQRRSGAEVATLDIGAHEEPPVVEGGLLELLEHGRPGVGDQHVDAAEPGDAGIDHRLHLVRLGDIGGDREQAVHIELRDQGVQPVLAPGGDDDVRPLRGEPPGDAVADAGTCPGDDDCLSDVALIHRSPVRQLLTDYLVSC